MSTLALLEEVSDFLDLYVDIRDGSDGQQLPNAAMTLKAEVDIEIDRLRNAAPQGSAIAPTAVTANRDSASPADAASHGPNSEDVVLVLRGFDEGVFVRDTSHDHENGWAIRALPALAALGRLAAAVKHVSHATSKGQS
jgi:hypothetical protein